MTETTIPARFADAPRAKSHNGLIHTCNGDVRSGLPFGRKNPDDCARCWELVNGAPAREDAAPRRGDRYAEAAALSREMREHFADPDHRAKCGPVCTAFDW